MLGKGRGSSDSAKDHQSAPLSSLRDPSSFGPPPKRVPGQPLPPPTSLRSNTTEPSGGLGSALSQDEIDSQRRRREEAEQAAAEEAQQIRAPTGPYRADTTGLTIANLPKPPTFRGSQTASPPVPPGRSKPPSLPPRLPPRTGRSTGVEPAPPPYAAAQAAAPSEGYLNQGAMNRLGQSGISVPGFNIGGTTSPPVPARMNSTSTSNKPSNGAQLGELQARFSKMNTSSATPASTGTTFEDKKKAVQTFNAIGNGSSSVSLKDVGNAASVANNFRERHGEQAAQGYKAANGMNQKDGIMDKMKSYSPNASSPTSPTSPSLGVTGKKAAPPPPAKRRELMVDPPPIPLGSKPNPSG
jgi:hypothetical protein